MRFDGTLTQWNDDKGFGFVMPAQGGQDVFIHISSFPRHGRRPQLQEPLSFEIELNKEGKKRAVSVRRSEVSSVDFPRNLGLQAGDVEGGSEAVGLLHLHLHLHL